jgi:hypothetical protein
MGSIWGPNSARGPKLASGSYWWPFLPRGYRAITLRSSGLVFVVVVGGSISSRSGQAREGDKKKWVPYILNGLKTFTRFTGDAQISNENTGFTVWYAPRRRLYYNRLTIRVASRIHSNTCCSARIRGKCGSPIRCWNLKRCARSGSRCVRSVREPGRR